MSSLKQRDREISRAMLSDRFRLRKRLRSIRRSEKEGRPFEQNWNRWQRDLESSIAQREQRQDRRPRVTFDGSLPVHEHRDEIQAAIADNQVVVICGETGSGKSTQIPKICLEMGRGIDGLIGHTQPRRIAARSVSARIASELSVTAGKEVGFKIRFTDTTSPLSYIKLMTDGILLAETQGDRFLEQYDTIIIDEAHERSLNIDFLLGYLKRLLPKRPELKLIITSATIDAERFSRHFTSGERPAPIIEVSGRSYPVEIRYRPPELNDDADADLLDGVLAAVDELAREGTGDVLIFMPTERDIRETARLLRGRRIPGDSLGRRTEILPLYGRLSTAEQNRVFEPHGHRRIVIATNVAESSLTVPGIRYVIDPGTARISRFSARSQVQRLPIEPISQASANQRAGRCGRLGPGVCIRVYSEEDYRNRDEYTSPEILRTNLASVILQTQALRLGNLETFPFLDPPKPTTIRAGYKTLFELGAIDERNELTELGRQLSRLPVDPRIGRMIFAGRDEGCLTEILIIAAVLEIQDPRDRPLDKQQAADEAHARFKNEDSDFLTYLNLWDFHHAQKEKLSRSQLRKACRQNFLSYNRMHEWSDIYRQLRQLVEQAGMKPPPRRNEHEPIHRALLTGLLSKIAIRGEGHEYTGAGGTKFQLWPGSGLFQSKPKWIMAAELVETSRRYLRTIARINPAWIEPLAEHLTKRSYSDPYWSGELSSTMAYETVTLFGLPIVPRRPVRYGRIDPALSREMLIQHGLVEGDISIRARFLKHNRQMTEEVEALQAKSRRTDLLVAEDGRYEFYDRRLPVEVYDGTELVKWLKDPAANGGRGLEMQRDDLLRADCQTVSPTEFPDSVSMQQMRLPLDYHLEPGNESDGVTLTVPVEGLNQLDPHRLGWLVPGLLEEKIVAMIRSLPKNLRRMFVPAPDTARQVLRELKYGAGNLEVAVAEALSRIGQEPIPATAFDLEKLPGHLRMNVRVVDHAGKELASGRDLNRLRVDLGGQASADFAALSQAEWNRDNVTEWDFGALPMSVEVNRGGVVMKGYPAVVEGGDSVSLRLLESPDRAAAELRKGLRRLFILQEHRRLKSQIDHLPNLDRISLCASTIPGFSLRRQLIELLADRAFWQETKIPRTEPEFRERVLSARNRLSVAVQDLAQLVEPLFANYHQARATLEQKAPPSWKAAQSDMQRQLAELVVSDFLSTTPWPWLKQFPRYFRAIVVRWEKLSNGLARDRELMQEIIPRWEQLSDRQRQHKERGARDPQLQHYRWMLEEYRVSLFAQQLGTAVKISEKRLDEQWAKVTA